MRRKLLWLPGLLVLAACVAPIPGTDIGANGAAIALGGCNGAVCRMPIDPPMISADGSEVTVPFTCRSTKWSPYTPKGQYETVKAIAYTVASGTWREVPFTVAEKLADDNSKDFAPTVPGDYDSAHACAKDCSQFAYMARVDGKEPGYFYEIFYSDHGAVRQLTHFHIGGTPVVWPRLSADGRTVVMRYRGYDIALIDVASGKVTIIPFGERAWKVCAAGD